MKKLRELLKRISKGEWVINFLVIFILCWIAVVVVKAVFKDREPSLNQKIDMIADHIGVRFEYVEPVEGYWKVVKHPLYLPGSGREVYPNGNTINIKSDSEHCNIYNINFEVDEERLTKKIRIIPGVSYVHIRGNYEIMVWKGSDWGWDKDKIHKRVVEVLIN